MDHKLQGMYTLFFLFYFEFDPFYSPKNYKKKKLRKRVDLLQFEENINQKLLSTIFIEYIFFYKLCNNKYF